MIIATIGNATLKLETLKDAEALLDIASRATLVEKTYGPDFRDFYFLSEGEKRMGIEIIESTTIHMLEEFNELKAARERKAAEAAAKATEAA